MSKKEILYITLPCYNEEEVLPETAKQLGEKLVALKEAEKIAQESRILFVDDGSKDTTWSLIEGLHQTNPQSFSGLKLTRNKGHQNALLAGLMVAKNQADMVVSMDADLQDDIDVIDGFLEEYNKGNDVVYGVRGDRHTDSGFKRWTAQTFYKLMGVLGVDIVYNHADCRLMSKRALEGLSEFDEVNLFLRGIVPLVGYSHTIVEYQRKERLAGESKYPLGKMISFAWDGVTSFSVRPIRMITLLGFIVFAVSLGLIVFSFIQKFMGKTVAGWSSLMVSIWVVGGLIILSLGVVGEYIGKIYAEVKARPKYLIQTFLDSNQEDSR